MHTKTQRTFDQVFQHPITHNLEWRDIRTLFHEIGQVEEMRNGNLKLFHEGIAVVFHAPKENTVVSLDEVNQLRKLLKPSGNGHHHSGANQVLLVIDHNEARIFSMNATDQEPIRITPYDPTGQKEHVHTGHDDTGKHQRPNEDAYYRQLVDALASAEQILIFGSGTGASSSMDMFVTWLKHHHPHTAELVIATQVVDQSHLTTGQLIAKAQEFLTA